MNAAELKPALLRLATELEFFAGADDDSFEGAERDYARFTRMEEAMAQLEGQSSHRVPPFVKLALAAFDPQWGSREHFVECAKLLRAVEAAL